MRAEWRARCSLGPPVPKGGLKEPRRAQWDAVPPAKASVDRAILAGGLGSGGRSPGFVQAATPAWVVFDKSGALTAIKRAR
jgi:hypothetical protein